ncbi:MAG: anthranilate phosphoribosyltransferase [Candidatus Hodarchaeaceae archaeon]|nr:anthranilate phosphoribosyltransferase [Candidatus Hodarchaeaceae archaeon]
MNTVQAVIGKLVERKDLTRSEAEEAMKCIMSGEATPAQISSFLTALCMKGETVDEITAFAEVMRTFATRITPRVDGVLVDTCGTGGDKIKTFNISTAAMFIAAGAGVPIAKHGNRSVTSKAGSADVVEALGVRIDLPPEEVQRCIETVGIGFMFAPRFHGAMKYATPVRREMGIRTVFNILGPLTNPAGAQAQVMGVYDAALTEKLASVLGNLGCGRAMVVHGMEGLDEISTLGETQISELSGGEVRTYKIAPEDFGIERTVPESIAGKELDENVRMMLKVLRGERGPRRDIVLLNAAAAIVVGGKARDLHEGVAIAANTIDSGRAYEKVVQLTKASGGDLEKLRDWEASL